MRNSGQSLLALLLVLCVSPGAGGAGWDGPGEMGDRFAAAVRFMVAVYPDLEGRVDRIQFTGRLLPGLRSRRFGVEVGTGHLFGEKELNSAECYGVFQFSDTGLLEFNAHGKCASGAENEAFRETVTRHPRWSESQILRELRRRGARFGPDAEERLTDRLPSAGVVSDIIGEIAQREDMTFRMPRRVEGKMLDTYAQWYVVFTIPANPKIKVIASLEPFDGRLIALLRVPPE